MEEYKYTLEALNKTLASVNDQIRAAGGNVSMADMNFINPLTHSIKSLETVIAMKKTPRYSGRYNESERAYDDHVSHENAHYQGGAYLDSHRYVSPEYQSEYDGESQRRRDSMGRYM